MAITRSSYAPAVGQWLHVKRTTRTGDFEKSFRAYVLPSTPGRLKSGAGAPRARVGGLSSARAGAGKVVRAAARSNAGRWARFISGRIPHPNSFFTPTYAVAVSAATDSQRKM